MARTVASEFKDIMQDATYSDGMYRFLQVVYHLYPEDKFHHLIAEVSKLKDTDEAIYKEIQNRLSGIKPFLSEVTYQLPALKVQKQEMTRQTLEMLGDKRQINGYMEIGSPGRYISALRKVVEVSGPIYIMNDVAPSNSLPDIFERGQLGKIGTFVPLNDYQPVSASAVADNSLDVITCFIGLHHCPPEKMDGFVNSLYRMLRPGGLFIIRDHDVNDAKMSTFVSLVHTVFNMGLKVDWSIDKQEFRAFKTVDGWSKLLESKGFKDSGKRILQKNDPSLNTLMSFMK